MNEKPTTMKAVKFKEHNIVIAKDQPEYTPLPAMIDSRYKQVPVLSCWKMSFRERLVALFTGRVWLSLLTFGKPLQPIFMTVDKHKVVELKPKRK